MDVFPHFLKHEGFGGNVSNICVLLCWRQPVPKNVEDDDGGHDNGQHKPDNLKMQSYAGGYEGFGGGFDGFGGYGGYGR